MPIPNKYLGCGYKGLVFCRNNGWLMENMDKGLTAPKWVLIVWPKIAQMPQSLFAQFVCPSPKVLDFSEKRLHWASIVRDSHIISKHHQGIMLQKLIPKIRALNFEELEYVAIFCLFVANLILLKISFWPFWPKYSKLSMSAHWYLWFKLLQMS